ncbi:hypothetical protein V5738_00455 [Salinisphaera sp. SPP-AMP-43]|uniref:hypothetical protein n=1 Tax=Salinisphaera sp. SPP-AMP-43 TaxID=3121288 RepID=UPI003C6E347F
MAEAMIGCPLSADQAECVRTTIDALRNAPDRVDREHVVALIAELTETSFEYHFQRPLRDLGVGLATRKSIDVGLSGAMRVIRSSMQRVVGGLAPDRYPRLADFLEDAYFTSATDGRPE